MLVAPKTLKSERCLLLPIYHIRYPASSRRRQSYTPSWPRYILTTAHLSHVRRHHRASKPTMLPDPHLPPLRRVPLLLESAPYSYKAHKTQRMYAKRSTLSLICIRSRRHPLMPSTSYPRKRSATLGHLRRPPILSNSSIQLARGETSTKTFANARSLPPTTSLPSCKPWTTALSASPLTLLQCTLRAMQSKTSFVQPKSPVDTS